MTPRGRSLDGESQIFFTWLQRTLASRSGWWVVDPVYLASQLYASVMSHAKGESKKIGPWLTETAWKRGEVSYDDDSSQAQIGVSLITGILRSRQRISESCHEWSFNTVQ